MAAELACLFPKEFKYKEAERRTQRHQYTFRFVSDKIKKSEEGDEHLCKAILVELTHKSTMKVVPPHFFECRYLSIVLDTAQIHTETTGGNAKWTNLNLVLNDTEVRMAALLANVREETDKSKNIEDLEETV